MAPRELFPWMGLREQVLLVLYYEGPKEVKALALELAERPRTLRYLLERVIPALERAGALVVEDGVARLSLEKAPPAGRQAPAEPKAKRSKRKEPSPVQALAEANPHVRGLLLQVGKRLPKEAQPLAASHPGVLLRAAEAALAYPEGRRASALILWLPEVRAWAKTLGAEAVEEALREAAKHAREPFPYAKKLLAKARPSPDEERGEVLLF
ncbi:hypothetical protein TTHNP3_00032 (plasmid) [Thermus thermophilus]|uniref:Uncharacterized protein n=1 Tax=Thermus thermophilus TaxID=274 RepID=A0A3P4AV86_THETH|nr:hypothetical protein [Thermus thermophilus]VCU54519.1 hypothetical protein TTHNP3_00032 [Thermus thermophilus]